MIKSLIIYNINDMNDLPAMERWLYKDHAPDIISSQGPIIAQFDTYRSVYVPKEMRKDFHRFGTYNWRVINQWWHENPLESTDKEPTRGALSPTQTENHNKKMDISDGGIATLNWKGNEGFHPPVYAFLPMRHTEDFKGCGRTLYDHQSAVRWLVAIKYPEGVSFEKGEDWYLNVHAQEIAKQDGLLRFFSSRTAEPTVGPFIRVSEMWYEDLNSWKRNVVEEPIQYTRPDWASHPEFPFLKPFVDFVGIFLDERPECNFLTELGPYIFTS